MKNAVLMLAALGLISGVRGSALAAEPDCPAWAEATSFAGEFYFDGQDRPSDVRFLYAGPCRFEGNRDGLSLSVAQDSSGAAQITVLKNGAPISRAVTVANVQPGHRLPTISSRYAGINVGPFGTFWLAAQKSCPGERKLEGIYQVELVPETPGDQPVFFNAYYETCGEEEPAGYDPGYTWRTYSGTQGYELTIESDGSNISAVGVSKDRVGLSIGGDGVDNGALESGKQLRAGKFAWQLLPDGSLAVYGQLGVSGGKVHRAVALIKTMSATDWPK